MLSNRANQEKIIHKMPNKEHTKSLIVPESSVDIGILFIQLTFSIALIVKESVSSQDLVNA